MRACKWELFKILPARIKRFPFWISTRSRPQDAPTDDSAHNNKKTYVQ